ncbi:MAG: riboflavin synthase [Patescibacteria group bacterium]
MFTGIVQSLGVIRRLVPTPDGWQCTIDVPPRFGRLTQGMSLAVNGICVSVVTAEGRQCTLDIMPETRRRTTFRYWRVGDTVNLERPLRIGDEIGGHFVTGHIDGVGKIVDFKHDHETTLTIQVASSLMQYIAAQGAIAIDGISLTVTRVRGAAFIVALIPYTSAHTTLGTRHVGDAVNVEVDLIARYVKRQRLYGP